MEFYEKINFLKGGIAHADISYNCLPTHMHEEIQGKPSKAGVLTEFCVDRADTLFGIVNGIDTNEWNPKPPILEH